MHGLVVHLNIGVVHPMRTAYVRTIFRFVRIKIQTCAYMYAVKNQRFANSFLFYAY